MTKKAWLLTAASFVASTALSNPSPCGFYAGAGLGLSKAGLDTRMEGLNAPDQGRGDFYKQQTQPSLKILAGYQAPSGTCFWAGEVFARTKDVNKKIRQIQLIDPNTTDPSHTDVGLKIERLYTFGLDVKFGRYFDETHAAYIGLGARLAQLKITFREPNNRQSRNDARLRFGLAPTVGYIHQICPKSSMNINYAFETYGRFGTKDLDETAGGSFKTKLRTTSHNLALTYTYHFHHQ